jgi:hypothetical protein
MMEQAPFDRAELRTLAGRRIYQRGRDYFTRGAVLQFMAGCRAADALVLGTRTYCTSLWAEADGLAYRCDCPMGVRDECCKHVVAVGLHWLGGQNSWRPEAEAKRLIEYAVNYLSLGEPSVAGVSWSDRVKSLLDELLNLGWVQEIVALTESALDMIVQARWLDLTDDSDHTAVHAERVRLIQSLCVYQVVAVQRAGADIEAVARRLLLWQLRMIGKEAGAVSLCLRLHEVYAALLGAEWRQAYQAVLKRWQTKLTGIMGDKMTLPQRRQLNWLRCRLEGESLIYGTPVALLAQRGAHDASATSYFVAELAEEALELFWREFVTRSTVRNYRQLKEYAQRLAQWPQWRERVLAHLRQFAGRNGSLSEQGIRRAKVEQTDYSELVCIWLEEGATEEAWKVAKTGGCADELWLKLAATRIRQQPEEALAVYRRVIERKLNQKNCYVYAEVVRLLRRVRRLLQRMGRPAEFDLYLDELRRRHSQRKKLPALLDRLAGERARPKASQPLAV